MKIAVVGNCQARPLAQVVAELLPNATISGIAIVHLLKDSEENAYAPIFESSDLILAQRVTDDYPCTFVRNSELRRKYGDRVQTWPNLYYAGYNPELTYLRGEGRKPLLGPLGVYHNKTFVDAWRRGMSSADALFLHEDDSYNKLTYAGVPEISMDELRAREMETDMCITDWIEGHMCQERLFFTFNHPAQVLIDELGRRLMQKVGFAGSAPKIAPGFGREPLGQYRCPVNPWVAKRIGCRIDEPKIFQGCEVMTDASGTIKEGDRRPYEAKEIVQAFFAVYDAYGSKLVG